MFILNENEDTNVGKRVEHFLARSRAFDMLVGFFFFNGINAVEKALTENPDVKLRVLVGMDADILTGRVVETIRAGRNPREDYLESLRRVMRSKISDTEKFDRRSRLFCDLLENERMEIRKTKEENHAKMYLFELREGEAISKTWITGSSNFSAQGLTDRAEVNVEMGSFGFGEARDYFDKLWDEATLLTATEKQRAEIVRIVRGESSAAEVSPYEAYLLLLKNYVETRERFAHLKNVKEIIEEPRDEFDPTKPKYTAFKYQMDAISNAKQIIEDYGGVIIADVVGLGKSVIGSVLGSVLVGGICSRGLVIAPPGLVGDEISKTGWCGYLEDFKLNWARFGKWEARSRGKLELIATDVRNARERGEPYQYVIVDEAHYFRNEDTQDYALLSEICRGCKVILMTATPFSNRPADMLALLKLFLPTRGAGLVIDGDLDGFFAKKQQQYDEINFCKKNLKLLYGTNPENLSIEEVKRKRERTTAFLEKILSVFDVANFTQEQVENLLREVLAKSAKEMRAILAPVMIRRNRLDLLADPDYKAEIGDRISKMEDPKAQYFELTSEQSNFYDRVIRDYFGENSVFTGAAYRPIDYVDPEGASGGDEGFDEHSRLMQQRNMHKFICRLLVKRFESSFAAFAKTLQNLKRNYETVLHNAFSPRKGVPGYVAISGDAAKAIEDLNDGNEFQFDYVESDKISTLRAEGKVYTTEDFSPEMLIKFKEDLSADIALMEKISNEVKSLNLLENDPKAKKLVSAVNEVLAGKLGRKKSNPERRKILIFSEYKDTVEHIASVLTEAFPGKVLKVVDLTAQIRTAVMKNFDAGAGISQDDFEVMVATDKMSEGFNLNRAGLIINYDIPWNPVRVIQRVGRINRIGRRVFDKLFIFNFFPTEQGASVTKQKTIAEAKMFLIHETIGEDAKIFSEEEKPSAAKLFKKLTSSVEQFEEPSFYAKAKQLWADVKKESPELAKRIESFPLRVKTFWKKEGTSPRQILFSRRGNAMFATESADGIVLTPLVVEDAIQAVECDSNTPRTQPSESFWKVYKEICKSLEEPPLRISSDNKSIAAKARKRLQDELLFDNCGTEAEFVKDLINDIDYRRTIPTFTLKEILTASKQAGQFEKFLVRLHSRLGDLKFDTNTERLERLIAEELQ